MLKFLSFILLNLLISYVNCENFERKIYLESIKNENVFQFFNPDFNYYLDLFDFVLNENVTKSDESQISKLCVNDLTKLRSALTEREEWALQIFESNGKPRAGYSFGTNHDLGNQVQCLHNDANKFDNQFCLVSLKSKEFFSKIRNHESYLEMKAKVQHQLTLDLIDFNFGTVIGTCIPKSCDKNSIVSILNKFLSKYEFEAVVQKHCTFKNDKTFITTELIASWVIILTLVILCLSTLFFDFKFLRPFSLKENFKHVYNLNSTSKETFLSGFKCFYILISVPAHFFGLAHACGIATFLSDNVKEAKLNFHWTFLEILERLPLGIDVIVFYTGFMMFIAVYDHIKNKKTNFIKSICFFPISLYPMFIGIIAVLFGFASFIDGPFVPDLIFHLYNLFWKTSVNLLTFTSNLISIPEQLIIFNWFNSVMLHLFAIFYFVMYLFTKSEKLGFLATGILICVNYVYVGYTMIKQNIPPFINVVSSDSIYFYDFGNDYMYFYNHLDVYAVGFIAGYLYKHNKVSFLKNPLVFYVLFAITFASALGAFYIPRLFTSGILPDVFALKLLYFIFKRSLLTSFPAFLVLSFKADYLKSFNRVLSWKYLLPTSRMAASFASCQFLYLFYWYFTQKSIIRFSFEILIKECLCAIVAIFFIAHLFYFFIEAPLMMSIRLLILGDLSLSKAINKNLDENENKLETKDLNENLETIDNRNELNDKKIR